MTPRCPPVDIVMPCYNCGRWLRATIESLLKQDYHNWRLLARDNCSQDDTREVLDSYKATLGARLVILADSGSKNIGMIGNFNALLAASTAPWVMLADADDLWLPNKLSLTLETGLDLESKYGGGTPTLVATDAKVVDAELNVIAESYIAWNWGYPRRQRRLRNLLMHFSPPSSTLALNRALLDVGLPLPPEFKDMQESWFAATATAFGQLAVLPEVTCFYRRHGTNNSGVPFPATIAGSLRRIILSPTQSRARVHQVIAEASQLAEAFGQRFAGRLSEDDNATVTAVASLAKMSPIQKRLVIIRHGLWFSSRLKNAAMMALL